jgi:hypothetical protein
LKYFDSNKKYSCRFDRIYLNNKSIRVCNFKTIGDIELREPISTTPSDHYGIVAKFDISKGKVNSNQHSSLSTPSLLPSSSSLGVVPLSKEDMRRKRIQALENSSNSVKTTSTCNFINETILNKRNNNNNNNETVINNFNGDNNVVFKKVSVVNELNNDSNNNSNNSNNNNESNNNNNNSSSSSFSSIIINNNNNNKDNVIIISDDDDEEEDNEDTHNYICPSGIDPSFFSSLPINIKLEFMNSSKYK